QVVRPLFPPEKHCAKARIALEGDWASRICYTTDRWPVTVAKFKMPEDPHHEKTEQSRISGAPSDTVLAQIPDHKLLRCIGRGAYGEVWLARSVMGAHRAVKVVWRKSFDTDRPFERELGGIQKFEPISRAHDGLVDVLHVGRNDD